MAQKNKQEQSVVRISPALHRKLKGLAVDKVTTMQALTELALARTFKELRAS